MTTRFPLLAALALLMLPDLCHATPPVEEPWTALTKGRNLALGKEAILAPVPLYRRTTTGNESFKLTDGIWKDERLPSSKAAVGWNYLNGPVNIIIDLGREEEVGAIIARFQGGEGDASVVMPRKVTASLSLDGKTYYEAASMTKVNGGEANLATEHPDRYLYREENGTYFIQPYLLQIDRKARYVALTVQAGVHNIFSDEVFIMESEKKGECAGLEGLEKTTVLSKGLEVRPKTGDTLYVTTNLPTPNYFYIADLRSGKEKKEPVRLFLELPEGIEVRAGSVGRVERDSQAPEGVNRWIAHDLWNPLKPHWQGNEGPLFLISTQPIPEGATATLYSDEKSSAENRVTVPLVGVEIPEVPPLKEVHVSLTWMLEADSYSYPDFLKTFKHVGFTGIGTFPRNHKTEEEQKRLAAFADEIRAAGLQVIYNESAFNVMFELFGQHPEIKNQISGKPGKALCPTYTGPYYRKEMERVAAHARLVRPDVIFHDTELWYRGHGEWHRCSRCQEAFKESGMDDWDQFMLTQGTRMTGDLHEAVKGTRADGGTPIKGNYNVVPTPPVYHRIYDFRQLYPKYFDFGMPVLYVRGDVERVHQTIREQYQKLGNRDTIPWMTAGTYGEFPPVRHGQMLLEALLNGARGVTYYHFKDHDPMDFYHQAVALRAIAPHEAILRDGALLEIANPNPALTVTLWGTEREALLLVGHYRDGADAPETATLTPEGREIVSVRPLIGPEETQEGSPLALTLKPGEHQLYHVTFKPSEP